MVEVGGNVLKNQNCSLLHQTEMEKQRADDQIRDSESVHWAGHRARLTTYRTFRRSAISSQLRLARGKEATQQSARSELLHFDLPASGIGPQAVEDPGKFSGDRGLSWTKEPRGVIDQTNIAPQWEACDHPFTRRVELASILNRAKPQRLFQSGSRKRTHSAALASRFQLGRLALGFDMLQSLLDRRMIAGFRSIGNLGGNRIQIDVNTCCQERLVVENPDTFEAALEERPDTIPPSSQLANLRPIW